MKWYTYLICFILIVVGTFCGIELYKEVKSESYINGSIDITNKFKQESFNYTSTSLVFYHDDYDDTNTYTFEKELLKVDNFDGEKNRYQVWLNDFVLLNADINSGSVSCVVKIDFYNDYGNVLCNASMHISIKYLSSKTLLTITTNGQQSAEFLERYFTDNGIRLKVLQLL